MEVLQKVREELAEFCFENIDNIKPETSLRDDLGMDSLDLVELCIILEEDFDIPEFTDEEADRSFYSENATVGDVVAAVEAKIKVAA